MGLLGAPYGFEGLYGLQWAPVLDAPDGWVQVGSIDTCAMNLHLQSTGTNEENTRYVLRCAAPAAQERPATPAAAPVAAGRVAAVVETWHPILYDRSHGWGGRAYDEAARFCARQARLLCPAQA